MTQAVVGVAERSRIKQSIQQASTGAFWPGHGDRGDGAALLAGGSPAAGIAHPFAWLHPPAN
jgi:hypothetical protein